MSRTYLTAGNIFAHYCNASVLFTCVTQSKSLQGTPAQSMTSWVQMRPQTLMLTSHRPRIASIVPHPWLLNRTS